MTTEQGTGDPLLVPYAPRLLRAWRPTGDEPRHMRVHGTLAFVDISGFTRLTERLSRKGKVGAEELSDVLDATFADLLAEAMDEGADLLKWGGDAVLLLFRGPQHAARGARAAYRMRGALRRVGRVQTSSGTVVLRISSGVHSGDVDFFLVGDPGIHRELLVCGPAATTTLEMEAAADAGQVGLSAVTAALLGEEVLGAPLLDGRLLRRAPGLIEHPGWSRPEVTAAPQHSRITPAEALSPPIRAHLLDGAGEPEHRAVTVGFVQFSGTDQLLAGEGPAALAAALDEVVRAVQVACAQHEVTFFESDAGRDGGKLMLTAGAPRGTGRHEERMLRVARQVVGQTSRLSLRVGVNQGHVFAGGFGPPYRRTWSIKGDAVNLAARLLNRAGAGQAVATREVLEHSVTPFAAEALEPFTVKGRTRLVHAAVLRPRPDEGDDEGDNDRPVAHGPAAELNSDLADELVGRAAELAFLVGALDEARAGRGRSVAVVGEPGIGKTRLVTELGREHGGRVLSTRCEAYESSTPYYPLRKLLRDALDLPRDPGAALQHLAGRVSHLVPGLTQWIPLLGIPLDLPVPATTETTELDGQFLSSRLGEVVVDLLTAALRDPTVLLVEDVDHIDDASADLLRRVAAAAEDRPWLLVTTRRGAGDDDAPASLRLGPLDAAASLALTRRVLAEHPLTPHEMQVLAERSGGNPMFLAALLREARRFRDVAELPDTVEALVASDIDRLSRADRQVLRTAAVLGAVVDEDALDRLLASDGGLHADALRRLDTFLVRGESGRLRFRSSLLRDIAYEGLPYRRRRLLHEQVGLAVEAGTSDPQGQCEVLSLHFFHAGAWSKAWRYSVLAGRRAADKDAHGEAIEFFERASRSVPRDGSVSPAELADVLERLADSRFLVGQTDEAIDAYRTARRVLRDDPVGQATLVEKEVRIDIRRRRFAPAMSLLTRSLHALEAHAGPRADRARSLLARRYAYSRFSQGRIEEALRWAEVAARHAEESLDKGALAQAWEMLNAIHAGSGRAEPLPYGLLALRANRELGDLTAQGHCLNNLAVEAFAHGRWDQALAQYREAADIFRRVGDSAAEGNAAFNEAELLVRQGRYDEAAPLLGEVLLVARAVEDDELEALALREQAQVVAATGDTDGGLALVERARQRFVELEDTHEVDVSELVRASILVRAGDHRAARRVLDAVAPDGDPRPLGEAAPRWHRLASAVRLAERRPAQARAELLAALESAQAGDDLFEQALALRDLVELARTDGEPEDPVLATRSREMLDAMGVLSGR